MFTYAPLQVLFSVIDGLGIHGNFHQKVLSHDYDNILTRQHLPHPCRAPPVWSNETLPFQLTEVIQSRLGNPSLGQILIGSSFYEILI